MEEFIFENKFLEWFLCFWSSSANFLDFQLKFWDSFVKAAFYVSSGDFWLDCLFYENLWVFHRLRAVKKKFWHCGAKASKSLTKEHFMCTKKFCGKFDFWKNFYNFFEYWSKFLRLLTKMLSDRKILSKVIFFLGQNSCLPTEVEGKCFWCSVRTSGRFVKTALYVSEWEFWSFCFFYEFFEFLLSFPTVGGKFCNIDVETSEKLLKVHSTWTTELFKESLFPEEYKYFYNSFEFWWKTLQTSTGKPSTGFGKLLSTLVQRIFLRNIIIFLEKTYAY